MEQELKIFIERLEPQTEYPLSHSLAPSFLQIEEKELIVTAPVDVKGKVFLTDHTLIFHLSCKTAIHMPCSICNKMQVFFLNSTETIHSFDLEELRESTFDYSFLVREDLLLQIPQFAECNEGKCSERESLSSYIKKSPSPIKKGSSKQSSYFPFADL